MSRRLAVLLLPLPLAACLSAGNTKGDFACKAPDGTCAPMTLIDGQAVAGLGASGGVAPTARSLGTVPAPSAAPAPLRTVASGAQSAGEDSPARTNERVLRVVFPAHIDPDGVYREESAAHAVIEPTAWAEALTGPALEPKRVPALRPAGVVPAAAGQAAAAPPAQSVLASMDEVVALQAARREQAAPSAGLLPPVPPVTADLPSLAVSKPAEASPASPPRPGAVVSSFLGPTRSVSPMSLAEAAAGMSAPPIARLDPRGPGNYDTPDVVAAVTPPPPGTTAAGEAGSAKAEPAMRTVRWKGKLYRIPLRRPATSAPTAVAANAQAPAPSVPTTADLNRRALVRAGSASASSDPVARAQPGLAAPTEPAPPRVAPPHPDQVRAGQPTASAAPAVPPARFAPTTDPATAAARVKAMAAPQLEVLASKDGVIDLAPLVEAGRKAPAAGEPRP